MNETQKCNQFKRKKKTFCIFAHLGREMKNLVDYCILCSTNYKPQTIFRIKKNSNVFFRFEISEIIYQPIRIRIHTRICNGDEMSPRILQNYFSLCYLKPLRYYIIIISPQSPKSIPDRQLWQVLIRFRWPTFIDPSWKIPSSMICSQKGIQVQVIYVGTYVAHNYQVLNWSKVLDSEI